MESNPSLVFPNSASFIVKGGRFSHTVKFNRRVCITFPEKVFKCFNMYLTKGTAVKIYKLTFRANYLKGGFHG
jgi:hypothetical protein